MCCDSCQLADRVTSSFRQVDRLHLALSAGRLTLGPTASSLLLLLLGTEVTEPDISLLGDTNVQGVLQKWTVNAHTR